MRLGAHMGDIAWRAMTGYDLDAVVDIAAVVHPGLFETSQVLAERQQLYRNGCYLLEVGDRPAGYVLSHPWNDDAPPALNTLLTRLPVPATTFYVHDLALLPVARRIGAASHIVGALAKHAVAQGLPSMSLVAVNGSAGFWERHGFQAAERPAFAKRLAGYMSDAQFMVRALA